MTLSSFTRRMCPCLAVLFLLVLESCGGGSTTFNNAISQPNASAAELAGTPELVNTFAAILTGAAEIPVTSSAAQGAGNIMANPATRVAIITVSSSGLSGTTASINEGQPGTVGPIIFSLSETALGSGIWTATVTLTASQFNSLQNGNLYFNILSNSFPNGEIRGQILSQLAVATLGTNITGLNALTAPPAFIAALRGSQETPPNPSAASGAGAVITDPATRSLVATITTDGIAGTAAHIHAGAPGIAGQIIVPLTETFASSGIWTATAILTDAQFSALTSGGFYLNVHSAAFPNGEIRGQILPVQQTMVTPTGAGISGTGIPGTEPVFTGTGIGTTGTGIGITATGIPSTTGIDMTGTTGVGTTGADITGMGTATGTVGTSLPTIGL